jgi:hypothetical protein
LKKNQWQRYEKIAKSARDKQQIAISKAALAFSL